MYVKLKEVKILKYFQNNSHKMKVTCSYRCLSATIDRYAHEINYLYKK